MIRLARDFFALPAAEKLRFDMSGGKKGGFIVSSHLQGEAVQDWREIVTYFSYPIKALNVMLMPKMRWLLIRVLQPTYRPLRRDPSSPWDLMPAYPVRCDHWSSPCVPTPAYPVHCYRCRF
ncbi:unnamed protein product [Fraxinus pennsylvanica]|uniref:Uncharacterized protein n=1 Tax=Fraxinus pennsylvanica TaxID=56036 RepID=A0AAD1Z6K4_9LAMI|nr:unnamed protein product [Fraxinus pennsylvanica]